MDSIKELYKIGMGPSSSHTMGPRKAAEQFKAKYRAAKSFRVTLYGSLGATGRGHLTDKAVSEVFAPLKTDIVWKPEIVPALHTNGMDFEAFDKTGKVISRWRVYSVGGGALKEEADFGKSGKSVYPMHSMQEILAYIKESGVSMWEIVGKYEEPDIWDYLGTIWKAMQKSVKHGLDKEGLLPGNLKLQRKAHSYYIKAKSNTEYLKRINLLFAYALACSEENASGGIVVTAPTCGSSGVVPSVLYLLKKMYGFSEEMIIHALATGGLVGNLAKKNASISGAEVGCQGEVGVACAMAAAAAAQLLGGTPYQIEYAAEMGLEHHLGLTCDPVCGLVQIPCIERNAMAAARGLDCAAYALLSDGRHRISYDAVLETMMATGRDMKTIYKETSQGGLARELGNMA